MNYDPIKIKLKGKTIEYYFKKHQNLCWFYEIHSVWNRKELEKWDEHMQEKMWYTPEIREKTLALMEKIIDK